MQWGTDAELSPAGTWPPRYFMQRLTKATCQPLRHIAIFSMAPRRVTWIPEIIVVFWVQAEMHNLDVDGGRSNILKLLQLKGEKLKTGNRGGTFSRISFSASTVSHRDQSSESSTAWLFSDHESHNIHFAGHPYNVTSDYILLAQSNPIQMRWLYLFCSFKQSKWWRH